MLSADLARMNIARRRAAVDDIAAVEEGATLSITASALLANDTDAENDPLRVSAGGDAVDGTVSLDGTTITYEHDGSETASVSFTYTVSGGEDTAAAIVTITVTPVNDPPVAVDDIATVDEGGTLSITAAALLANDSDAESDALVVSAVGNAVDGSVSLDGAAITYKHDGSETTSGGFTYTVSDGADTATALVAITVSPVIDLPVVPLIALVLGIGLVTVVGLIVVRVRRTTGPSPTP